MAVAVFNMTLLRCESDFCSMKSGIFPDYIVGSLLERLLSSSSRKSLSPESHIVLVVDDDEIMLTSVKAMLRRGGYLPITACGPMEALRLANEFQGEIHLLLTDIVMPDMTGPALAQQVAAERRGIRVLLMTGYTDYGTNGLPLLKKPFGMRDLLERVRNVIDGPPPFADRS